MSSRRKDPPEEQLGRALVQRALGPGVRVVRHDDGTADRMPDALIHYPDGRTGSLEFVGDHDEHFRSQGTALRKSGSTQQVPGLQHGWVVSLSYSADLRQVRTGIGPALQALERAGGGDRRRTEKAARLSEDLDRLGVYAAFPSPGRTAGQVVYSQAPVAGWPGSGDEAFCPWVEQVLARNQDVAEKLLAADLGQERHAFVLATFTSDSTHSLLDGADVRLPVRDPQLPEGITHLWVGAGFSSTRLLFWSPEAGWRAFDPGWSQSTKAEALARRLAAEMPSSSRG